MSSIRSRMTVLSPAHEGLPQALFGRREGRLAARPWVAGAMVPCHLRRRRGAFRKPSDIKVFQRHRENYHKVSVKTDAKLLRPRTALRATPRKTLLR
jgi:hypothetical protein